jgi:hypothetical protein
MMLCRFICSDIAECIIATKVNLTMLMQIPKHPSRLHPIKDRHVDIHNYEFEWLEVLQMSPLDYLDCIITIVCCFNVVISLLRH